MKDHVISGIVIESKEANFDIVVKTGKILVSQEFLENIEKVFEREFCVSTIKLIE